jgi:Transposase DDE domain
VWAVPSETTIRRTLTRLDAEALAAIGAWLADRDRPDRRRRAVTVDGKTLRGARNADGRQVHLLAAMDHATRTVLAQRHVDGAPGEVPGLRPLLADLDLAGVVVTADALHTHPDAAEYLVTGKRAHYLFTVKANQPTLLDRCARLACQQVPVLNRTATATASSCAPSRPSPCTTSGSRTPPRSSRSPARPANCGPGGGGP